MLDETKERKDNSTAAPGGSSGGTKGTSKDKGKLYTPEQILKERSDAAAKTGRERDTAIAERDTLKQDLQSTTSRLDALEREQNESRLAEARGDPDQLRAYQKEQSLTKREREVEARDADISRREGQVKADRADVDKDRGVVSIAYIAAKHGLETEELESLGISDHDTLEKVAEKLAAAKTKEPAEGEEGEEGEEGKGEGFTPDSGETTGGLTGIPALEKANEDFSKGLITEKQLQEIASKTK